MPRPSFVHREYPVQPYRGALGRQRGAGIIIVGLAWAVAAGLGCGLQAHPAATPESEGSGGQSSSGSGGQSNGSGGNTGDGSGGQSSSGSGGQSNNGSGGQSSGSGGQSNGSGGQSSSGSGGQSNGTGGQSSSGSGGQNNGSGGQSVSSGGAKGSGGASGSGGSGAGAGPGVMINGTFVPKDKAVVFIHFGHSNMRGQATKPSSLMTYFYNPEQGLWSYNGSFKQAKEPTAPEGSMTFAGPGMAILHSARAAVASGSDVQFISIGFGRGSVTTVDYAPKGTFYNTFMKWAGDLKDNVTFGAIVIMLGVTDGEHLPSNLVPDFPARVADIVKGIRDDLGQPNLPVMFCDYEQMATGTLAPTGSVGKVMQPLVRMLPDKVTKLVLVPTDGLEMQDDHHFDMQGHKDWANRLIMLMQSNGWFPWK